MRKQKNLKKERGITLIALVVTIVVLLILAGISINAVLGNNGLITKARDAKNKTEEDTVNTEKAMNNLYDEMLDILGENAAKTLVEAFNDGEINIGDYLNYSDYVNASKAYTSETDENGWTDQTYSVDTATQWRVLGLNEDETQLLLISADPIKKNIDSTSENTWDQDPYLYMKGAYSYVNCVQMLNNISGIYSTSLGTARSITVDDINNILGITVAEDGVYQKDNPTVSIDEWGELGSIYTFEESKYSPESYINGKSYETEGKTLTTTGYLYGWTDFNIDDTIQEILFSGTTSDDNYSKSYWLASPGFVYHSSWEGGDTGFGPGIVHAGRVDIGVNFFSKRGNWSVDGLAVRPIIVLNADVTVDDLQVITGEESTWTCANDEYALGAGSGFIGEAGVHEFDRTQVE